MYVFGGICSSVGTGSATSCSEMSKQDFQKSTAGDEVYELGECGVKMRRAGEEGAGERASERERVGWRRPECKTGRSALRAYEFYKGCMSGWRGGRSLL